MDERLIDFKTIFENCGGLNLILTPDLTIIAVSDSYLEATLTQRETIIGKKLFDIFPDNPADTVSKGTSNLSNSLKKVLETKRPHLMEIQKYDVRNSNGEFEIKYWSPFNKPVLNKKNEVVYIIHQVEDITEYFNLKRELAENNKLKVDLQSTNSKMEKEIIKRSDEIKKMNKELEERIVERTQQLLQTEHKFQSILDVMIEGIQIINSDWRYVYVNHAVANQGKNTKAELEGKTMMEMYPGIENSPFFKILEKCMNEKVPAQMENEFRHPNGELGWFDLSIQPIQEGVFILSIDITHRKKIEEEILKLNTELEKKVVERTEQLSIINKELESFCYSVSHDLRSPLRAIDGYSKILAEDYSPVLDNEGLRLLKVVQTNSKRMGNLIDDLLAFSHLGKKELRKSTVDINKLVKSVVDEILLTSKNTPKIIIHDMPEVSADYSLLTQAFTNLISNAIKYSSKNSESEINIGAEKIENATKFYVKDNGVGFDMKYIHKLFGVFQRLHRTEEFEGTGVGLAIVHRIISKHGGEIWADAEMNKGATFYFTLPDKITI